MEEPGKRTRWMLWIVVAFVVFGYPLSCPPVMNLVICGRAPHAIWYLYRPVYFVTEHLPRPIERLWDWYYEQWTWVVDWALP